MSIRRGKWEEVSTITDKLRNEEQVWNPMVISTTHGETLTMAAPGVYTPNGSALIELVRFYWQHPERREELIDGRAAERLPAT